MMHQLGDLQFLEAEAVSYPMQFSVVIPTHNRAGELRETLSSLAEMEVSADWELIIVDNNSTDSTRDIVLEVAKTFPVKLHYFFEPEPGRSAALNAGIRASQGSVIATTDDDVRVEPDWLDQAAKGLSVQQCDFVGGKVLPVWGGPRPAWLSDQGGRHWSVIALLDYGSRPLEFGKYRAPLGVNLAFQRQAFARVGLWNTKIGRKAGGLLGQEVREWMLRSREAGLKGMYIPEMVVHHRIPKDRLSKRYFRRWFYWHGVSRAMLFQEHPIDMQAPEETGLDFTKVPMIFGVPRYMYRSLVRSVGAMMNDKVRGKYASSFEHELGLWFFVGVLRQRWKDRKQTPEWLLGSAPVSISKD